MLREGAVLDIQAVRGLPEAVRGSDGVAYGISFRGGEMDGAVRLGSGTPSRAGRWSAGLVACGGARRAVGGRWDWTPGTSGCCWGHAWEWSSGAARPLRGACSAQLTPQSRSGEFFSFFGFMSRMSSVFGPMLYIAATAVFDTRVAVTSILMLIVAGAYRPVQGGRG